jgi:RNA polymerase sigma-70 factor, ECF subfamily
MKESFQPDTSHTSGQPQPAPFPIHARLSTDVQLLPLNLVLKLCLEYGTELLWTEFVRRCQPLIAGVVGKCVRRWANPTPARVDDLVQETFLKLCTNDFKALRDFHCTHENALYGFLKVVASNVVHDHFRGSYSQKRGNGREDEELQTVSLVRHDPGATAQHVERKILLQEISDCLETQAAGPNYPRDCAIFWLYYTQGYTAKAIAELPSIGLTVKGVESTLLRLTRLVREGLNGKLPGDRQN